MCLSEKNKKPKISKEHFLFMCYIATLLFKDGELILEQEFVVILDPYS